MVRGYKMPPDSWMVRTVLLGALLLLAVTAQAQHASVPEFDVDAVTARANGSATETRLDVYTKIAYERLRFLSTPDGFTARYVVTADVRRLDGDNRPRDVVQSQVWEQSVVAASFAQTHADALYDRTVQTLDVPPGRYLVEFRIEDQATNEAFVRELPVEVRDLSRPVAVGDLILIDDYDAETNSITPSVSNRLSSGQAAFQLFYEVYADEPREVRIVREVVRVSKSSGVTTIRSIFGLGRDDEGTAEVTYQEVQPQRLARGRNQYVVQVPLDDFKVGEYVARVRVEGPSGRELDVAEKTLVLQWSGLAEHVQDLEKAIAQLEYIAKRRDVNYIRDGKTAVERRQRFLDFWKRRDPTPGTDRNERMEEYYYRIAYANHRYGSADDGWRTDRGHVMILFGEPDFVERHPVNADAKPYEVWFYYNIGRRFIFVDETGGGDYQLLVPMWDERTRIR